MNSVAAIREVCAGLAHSQETFPFGPGALVFKVGGKMYALTDIHAEPLTLSLKVRPERGEELRAKYPAIVPGYHLNKRHWVTLNLGGVPADLARTLLHESYALVVGGLIRAQRAELEL
ncbi:MmcQ-like protein [Deinococcus irradiatisoli]|uniref:MmcQ-like protein n=1 Tax=Deinococcus irradiatisoli TaxID=2202254 RepID=A0A2Z3JAB7_9DEIO|nr:MmcQ/YjbR family DNA-binding protein [Deinococcus irradiatisoli]AWN22057.1 MmcQ-like protein [Deinococcus irradiatisoli]